jgi:5-methylcytosine-specific restriction endonuclease McrA
MNKVEAILNALHENTVLVKNMHSGNQKIYGGALNTWKKIKGYDEFAVIKCARCKTRDAEQGGHVVKANPKASKEWYIVPLCVKCNEKKDEEPFEVKKDDLVPVVDMK